MSIENPTFNQPKQAEEPNLNEQGKEALQDLKLTLEAQKIPDDERQAYIDRFIPKIDGETDEDMIDMALGNILLDATKRAKELKSSSESSEKEGVCPKCGMPTKSSHSFCGQCGNKLK